MILAHLASSTKLRIAFHPFPRHPEEDDEAKSDLAPVFVRPH